MQDITDLDAFIPTESEDELRNFQQIAKYVVPSPGDIPELPGIEIYGRSLPLNGIIGGDHIIYVDFKKRYDLEARIEAARSKGQNEVVENLIRCRSKAGIALADVSGHRITDGLLAMMLHQAFLLGAIYELDFFGQITTRLFENLNTRFYKSSKVGKFLTMIYGEISQWGQFQFVTAAHPTPIVFSRFYDRLVDICPDSLITFPPIGTMPSFDDIDRRTSTTVLGFKEKYEVNEINLMGNGDILILLTDGLSEHGPEGAEYTPARLEAKLRQVKDLPARQIFEELENDLLAYAEPGDDLSFVVIKRL